MKTLQTKVAEKIETQIKNQFFLNFILFYLNLVVYEINGKILQSQAGHR